MDGHAGFGSREFELALLDDMYDQARSRTEAALRALGATREQASQAKDRRRTRSPWSVGDFAPCWELLYRGGHMPAAVIVFAGLCRSGRNCVSR